MTCWRVLVAWVLLQVLPTGGWSQNLPIDLFLTYQFAPEGSSVLQRDILNVSVTVSPTTFDQLVADVRTRRDEAPVFRQMLIDLVGKHQAPRLLWPEVMVLQNGPGGPSQRIRFPGSGPDIILYDRFLAGFDGENRAFDYVRRGSRGTKKLFGP